MKIATQPFDDQLAGTSGLRKKLLHFQQQNYLENFIQSIFNCLSIEKNTTLILGGDGRLGNLDAAEIIIRIARANGIKKIITGQNFMLSTPAISHLIRTHQTIGGIILTASHNSADDFGIKFNNEHGAPASEKFMKQVFEETLKITHYNICQNKLPDFNKIATHNFNGMEIEIIDPCKNYFNLMKTIFDFNKIKTLFNSGFHMRFDCLQTISALYARTIFVDGFGVDESCLLNSVPDTRFGNKAPDPNPIRCKTLFEMAKTFDICFACDADIDRNLIIGKNCFINPSDSLAILTANAHLIPFYADGLKGVARSMPTSRAVDSVAAKLDIPCYEVPTGWKFFAPLLELDKISICGEESFGTGSHHIREKDGLWACLMWLNIIAEKKMSAAEIVHQHWQTFGRHAFCRHDFNLDLQQAQNIMSQLEKHAEKFLYKDENGRIFENGIYINNKDGSRIVCRMSGTDTQQATLRIYLEYITKDFHKTDFTKLVLQYQNLTKLQKPDFII